MRWPLFCQETDCRVRVRRVECVPQTSTLQKQRGRAPWRESTAFLMGSAIHLGASRLPIPFLI
jgi:hypothetical protein